MKRICSLILIISFTLCGCTKKVEIQDNYKDNFFFGLDDTKIVDQELPSSENPFKQDDASRMFYIGKITGLKLKEMTDGTAVVTDSDGVIYVTSAYDIGSGILGRSMRDTRLYTNSNKGRDLTCLKLKDGKMWYTCYAENNKGREYYGFIGNYAIKIKVNQPYNWLTEAQFDDLYDRLVTLYVDYYNKHQLEFTERKLENGYAYDLSYGAGTITITEDNYDKIYDIITNGFDENVDCIAKCIGEAFGVYYYKVAYPSGSNLIGLPNSNYKFYGITGTYGICMEFSDNVYGRSITGEELTYIVTMLEDELIKYNLK